MIPSLTRDWAKDQKILTSISIIDETISLENIRSFRYQDTDDYTVLYYNATYNISDVVSVDYIIEPFGNRDGFAHTMLSF